MSRGSVTRITLLLLAMASPTAHSVELVGQAGYRIEHTDNVFRSATEKRSEIIHRPVAEVSATHSGPTIEADADVLAERRIFEDNSYEGRNVLRGSGTLVWHAVEDRLDVNIRNTRAETTIDAFEPVVEDNLQTTNLLEVNPELFHTVRGRHRFKLGYSFIDINTSRTENDSQRNGAVLEYALLRSDARILRLEGRFSEVEYDSDDIDSFDQAEALISYTTPIGRRAMASGAIGRTWIYGQDERPDTEGMIGNLNVNYQINRRSMVSLAFSQSVRDNSVLALTSLPSSGIVPELNSDTADIRTLRQGSLGYTYSAPVGTILVRGRYLQSDFQQLDRDQNQRALEVGYGRDFLARFTLQLRSAYSWIEFENRGRKDDVVDASASLHYLVGRSLLFSAGTLFRHREGDFEGGDYDETRYFFTVAYRFPPGTRPRSVSAALN